MLAEGLAYLYANILWWANISMHMLMGKCEPCRTARVRAKQPCLDVFLPCDWLWSLYFFGDRKGITRLHKHHIILSPYLWAQEILYTNDSSHSACERIMSNSKLNWHFKGEKVGVWLQMEATECICFCCDESRSPFPAAFPPVFKPVIHALLSPRWHKCASFRPVYEAAD